MKKIYKDKILNIPETDVFDSTFLFEYFINIQGSQDVEIIYLRNLLHTKKNEEILERVGEKPAMYSEVYSPSDELDIFSRLFENALSEKKKIHIV